jgi:hypothetical protein
MLDKEKKGGDREQMGRKGKGQEGETKPGNITAASTIGCFLDTRERAAAGRVDEFELVVEFNCNR